MAITPLQTDYNKALDRFIKGQIPDMRAPCRDISRDVQDEVGVEFGTPVGQGTGDRQCRPLATGLGTKYLGFAVLDKTTGVEGKYPRYKTARIRQVGPLVVTTSVNAAAGDLAYVVPATGLVTNVATNNTLVGQYETSGTAGSLVIINLK